MVGRPDPEWGQRVVAVVVPPDAGAPPSLDELRGHVKRHLPAYAAPAALELVDALPRTVERQGPPRRAHQLMTSATSDGDALQAGIGSLTHSPSTVADPVRRSSRRRTTSRDRRAATSASR